MDNTVVRRPKGHKVQQNRQENIDQQFEEGREFVRETLRNVRTSSIPEPYRPLVKHLLKG